MDQEVDVDDRNDEETSSSTLQSQQEGTSMIQNIHYYIDGDMVQGSKTDIKVSSIKTLNLPFEESNPPTHQHPDELSGDNPQAGLELIDEVAPALNECIQTKLNRKVYDFLQELLTDTDNLVREKEICSILRDINSVTKSLDTAQDKGWTSIGEWTTFSIKYNSKKSYRKGSKVFDAIRESGGDEQKIIVKFVPDFIPKNRREIDSLWATTGHENVVKYFRSGICKFEGKNAIFIAMEKCEEKTLFEKIEDGNLSYNERKATVYSIAKGLQHLKKKGILHRDLKPQNILYRNDVPVISDFGLSKRISREKSHALQSGPNRGTFGWMAPEASEQDGGYGFEGDIYSAGLVNFYVLTNGKHPFGEKPEECQPAINKYPDKRMKKKGEERNLDDLKNIGVLDETIAIDMIELMLDEKRKRRPTVEAVLEHPLFWTVEKKLNFFTDTYKCIEYDKPSQSELNKREGKYGSQIQDEMENWKHQSGGEGKKNWEDQSVVKENKNLKDQDDKKGKKNWKDKLSFTDDELQMIQENFAQQNVDVDVVVKIDSMASMARKAKKCKDSVTGLLHFIRNKYTHSNDDKKKGIINFSDEQFLTYFFDRFPHLLVYVYCTIKNNYYGETKSKNCYTNILAKYVPLLQPNIIRNEVNNNSLEIEWEPVICATSYKLEIYTNNSVHEQPVFKKSVEKKTEWAQAFDDNFGYGTSYYAVVTAVGDENKRSSTHTDQKQLVK